MFFITEMSCAPKSAQVRANRDEGRLEEVGAVARSTRLNSQDGGSSFKVKDSSTNEQLPTLPTAFHLDFKKHRFP